MMQSEMEEDDSLWQYLKGKVDGKYAFYVNIYSLTCIQLSIGIHSLYVIYNQS